MSLDFMNTKPFSGSGLSILVNLGQETTWIAVPHMFWGGIFDVRVEDGDIYIGPKKVSNYIKFKHINDVVNFVSKSITSIQPEFRNLTRMLLVRLAQAENFDLAKYEVIKRRVEVFEHTHKFQDANDLRIEADYKRLSKEYGSLYARAAYKIFAGLTRGSPKVYLCKLNSLIYRHFVGHIDKRLLTDFCFGMGGINPAKLAKIEAKQELLKQIYDDNLRHIAPICNHIGANPSVARKVLGKGLWKALCKNTFSRNKLIVLAASRNQIHYEKVVDAIRAMSTLRTKYLTNDTIIRAMLTPGAVAFLNYNRNSHVSQRELQFFLDMYNALYVGPDLPLSRLEATHDAFVKSLLLKKGAIDDTPFKWAQFESFEIDGFKFTPLRSEFEIYQEGVKMHHCVGMYRHNAARMSYFVMKVDGKGERATLGVRLHRATADSVAKYNAVYSSHEKPLELAFEEKIVPVFEQCFGACNMPVSDEMLRAANKAIYSLEEFFRNANICGAVGKEKL